VQGRICADVRGLSPCRTLCFYRKAWHTHYAQIIHFRFEPQSVITIRSVFLLYVERLFVGFLQA
jgi:hypothetical protein